MSEPIEKNEERENRIIYEAVVDAYDETERAMGWYYYLEDKISFPFQARCKIKKRTSPLKLGETVKVLGLSPTDECENSMFVEIEWDGDVLDVPLEQIEPLEDDEDTNEAIEDWHYWVARNYQF
jgi:hypothetical protein